MISLQDISVRFGGDTLFDKVSVMISPQDKIGLIGRNGAGKSTLLKLIIGEESPSDGTIAISQDLTLGYLPQQMKIADGKSVMDEVLSAFDELNRINARIEFLQHQLESRTDYESEEYSELIQEISEKTEYVSMHGFDSLEGEAERMLTGLGFERKDFIRPTSEFSGGWRMRIELAKLLLKNPDILLLDEPTNHLDIVSIDWLEGFLKQYKGIIILISHDRAFLDAITDKTFEISLQKLTVYAAPYSKYLKLKEERYEQELAAYENQQKMIADTEKFIERFRYKATKSVQVQSRIKQLDKIDRLEIEKPETGAIRISFPPAPRAGSVVLRMKNVTKEYGNHVVLKDVNLAIERGHKIALLGKNGEGKSTCIKTILQEIEYQGDIVLGHNVEIGYFAQNQDQILNNSKTVFETLDSIAVGDVRTKVRDILGSFYFSGDDVEKKVAVLSGGERNRLAMAKLMLQPYNLLILDEPTNHLDIQSKAVLKAALKKYDGTVILVSHDRDFLDGLTTHLYEVKNTQIREVIGDLKSYLKQLHTEELSSNSQHFKKNEKKAVAHSHKKSNFDKKEWDRQVRKVKTEITRIETKIEQLEIEMTDLNTTMIEQTGNVSPDLYTKHADIQKGIEASENQWEGLIEKLSGLEAENR
ncbi:MAG: ATP-binding cassette domain-containing protein [Bacteroidota bacterium]